MMRVSRSTTPDIVDANALPALKRFLRIDGEWADTELELLLEQAIASYENRTRSTVFNSTYAMKFHKFPYDGCFHVPYPPLVSVTTITYYDADDVQQTWASTEYDVITDDSPGRVQLAWEKTLPTFSRDIEVTYVAGNGSDWDSLPKLMQFTLSTLVHSMWHNRDGREKMRGTNELLQMLEVGDEFIDYP